MSQTGLRVIHRNAALGLEKTRGLGVVFTVMLLLVTVGEHSSERGVSVPQAFSSPLPCAPVGLSAGAARRFCSSVGCVKRSRVSVSLRSCLHDGGGDRLRIKILQ